MQSGPDSSVTGPSLTISKCKSHFLLLTVVCSLAQPIEFSVEQLNILKRVDDGLIGDWWVGIFAIGFPLPLTQNRSIHYRPMGLNLPEECSYLAYRLTGCVIW